MLLNLLLFMLLQDAGDTGCHGDVPEVMEEVFVSLSPRTDTLGKQGTKAA
jgi:hypothetical protein